MSRRLLLCHKWSDSSDGKLFFGVLFGRLCNGLFKLCCWFLPSYWGLVKLCSMYRRVILRDRGSYRSDRRLRSGLILGRVFNHMFELFGGILRIFRIINELLKLSSGLLSGLDGIYYL